MEHAKLVEQDRVVARRAAARRHDERAGARTIAHGPATSTATRSAEHSRRASTSAERCRHATSSDDREPATTLARPRRGGAPRRTRSDVRLAHRARGRPALRDDWPTPACASGWMVVGAVMSLLRQSGNSIAPRARAADAARSGRVLWRRCAAAAPRSAARTARSSTTRRSTRSINSWASSSPTRRRATSSSNSPISLGPLRVGARAAALPRRARRDAGRRRRRHAALQHARQPARRPAESDHRARIRAGKGTAAGARRDHQRGDQRAHQVHVVREPPTRARPARAFAPGCDAFAAWGSRTAGGRLFSSRNLDWNKDTGIAAHKLVTVFHPDDGTAPYATFGFASGLGAIAGMSKAGPDGERDEPRQLAHRLRGPAVPDAAAPGARERDDARRGAVARRRTTPTR